MDNDLIPLKKKKQAEKANPSSSEVTAAII